MPPLRKAGLAALGLSLLAVLGWALLFFTGQQRVAAQRPSASCQADLTTALMAQERFRAERGRYADEGELGLSLPSLVHRAEGPDAAALSALGVGRSATTVVVACRADGRWWTVSSADRQLGADKVPAGTPARQ